MTLLYVLPSGENDFEAITTANDSSNPLVSTTVAPSSDYRLFKVVVDGNVDMSFKVQYANSESGPWMSYSLDSEDFDSTGGQISIYVMLLSSKYTRVIVWNTDTDDGQVKVTIDTDPIVGYVSIDEVRDYLKVQSSEYDDSSISQLIVRATREIDDRTGRTWQAVRTVTDEYITPGDSKEVQLENVDVQSITAFSVDESNSGTYTTVTASTLKFTEDGIVRFSTDSEVQIFPEGDLNAVKASYTYGNTNPTYAVKALCLNMIKNYLMQSDEVQREIRREVNKLIGNKYSMI